MSDGLILRTSRGWYSLPIAQEGRLEALRLHGTASRLSAANHWGRQVKTTPETPHVTVRGKRSPTPGAAKGVVLHWRDLEAADGVASWVTSKVKRLWALADGRAANPFESMLRATAFRVRGLRVHPQQGQGTGSRRRFQPV